MSTILPDLYPLLSIGILGIAIIIILLFYSGLDRHIHEWVEDQKLGYSKTPCFNCLRDGADFVYHRKMRYKCECGETKIEELHYESISLESILTPIINLEASF